MKNELFNFEYPNVWTALKESKKPIVLYGMGNGADKVLDEMSRRGIAPFGVMATDAFVRYQDFRGFTVQKQSDFENAVGDFTVALCFGSSLPDVLEHIHEVGRAHELLVPNVPVVGNIIMDEDFISENRSRIEEAYSLLADERSRLCFKGALHFYYTGRLKYLTEIDCEKDEIFTNILCLKDEAYLDLGAYRGDTVDEFLHYTKGFKSIVALEPNPKNYKKLCEHIKNTENATALNMAASDKSGTMYISKKSGRMAALSTEGEPIGLTSVDELNLKPTYIKVDIEGEEAKMLSGAKCTLKALKPKLNLAAYHRTEDFFELILQLHKINPDYKIYLRKHPYIPCWDLNIYAI